MKALSHLIVSLVAVVVVCSLLFADPPHQDSQPIAQEEEKHGFCPHTNIVGKVSDCLICHKKGAEFGIKEIDPDENRAYPCYGMFVREGYGYYVIRDVGESLSDDLLKFFDYLDRYAISHAVLELHSPGGSLFEAWRVAGLMNEWEAAKPGRIVETRVYGFAASAGFLIAVSGTIGYRFASPTAELMWHELMSFKMFSIATPSSSEEEMKVLRHLQDTANEWLASRSKLTKEELDEKIKKKEFWCNGRQALEYGFVDHLLGVKE